MILWDTLGNYVEIPGISATDACVRCREIWGERASHLTETRWDTTKLPLDKDAELEKIIENKS